MTARTAPHLALLGIVLICLRSLGEPLCTAGRTGTLFPLICTPDSLFHTSAFLGIFPVTATVPALQDLHKTSKDTPLKELLVVSRTKIHPPMPDLIRQSHTESEQQQKGHIYSATSTMQRTLRGISNSLNSEQGVQPDWMFGRALPSFIYTFQYYGAQNFSYLL